MDWSYIDRKNKQLVQEYGFKYEDIPTIFAMVQPGSGKIYKQNIKYNSDNFYEISEGFKRKVESGSLTLWSASWRHYYLNLFNTDYWKSFRLYSLLRGEANNAEDL